ncbi:MAG: Rrf2 family transcriptional regulator [Verrucomicrobia bacterium]|nr:Rrf2 family transcriptional regulator [Verrucomicrobiota bacterium]
MAGNSRFAVSVHILAYLAYRKEGAVSSSEIAASVGTNPVVIRRLLSALVKARLVTAQKGASGGFALASTPAGIPLLAVYRTVEPKPDHGLNRFAPNHRCPVGARIESVLQGIFFKAQAGMEAELARVNVAEVERQLHAVCARKP